MITYVTNEGHTLNLNIEINLVMSYGIVDKYGHMNFILDNVCTFFNKP